LADVVYIPGGLVDDLPARFPLFPGHLLQVGQRRQAGDTLGDPGLAQPGGALDEALHRKGGRGRF
jgi:hypothetical protein